MDVLQEKVFPVLCQPIFQHEAYMDWLLAAALASPHFLYAFIWFFPDRWQDCFGKQSVDAFATLAYIGKALQFQAIGLWFWSARSQGLCFDGSPIQLWQWLACLLLVAFGQCLNVGIYKAIGVDGVYYGFKLGKSIPWVNGFPFNVVPHPQYVGSTFTVWGVAVLLWTQVPAGSALQLSVGFITAFWTLLYVITGIMEQYF